MRIFGHRAINDVRGRGRYSRRRIPAVRLTTLKFSTTPARRPLTFGQGFPGDQVPAEIAVERMAFCR